MPTRVHPEFSRFPFPEGSHSFSGKYGFCLLLWLIDFRWISGVQGDSPFHRRLPHFARQENRQRGTRQRAERHTAAGRRSAGIFLPELESYRILHSSRFSSAPWKMLVEPGCKDDDYEPSSSPCLIFSTELEAR